MDGKWNFLLIILGGPMLVSGRVHSILSCFSHWFPVHSKSLLKTKLPSNIASNFQFLSHDWASPRTAPIFGAFCTAINYKNEIVLTLVQLTADMPTLGGFTCHAVGRSHRSICRHFHAVTYNVWRNTKHAELCNRDQQSKILVNQPTMNYRIKNYYMQIYISKDTNTTFENKQLWLLKLFVSTISWVSDSEKRRFNMTCFPSVFLPQLIYELKDFRTFLYQ